MGILAALSYAKKAVAAVASAPIAIAKRVANALVSAGTSVLNKVNSRETPSPQTTLKRANASASKIQKAYQSYKTKKQFKITNTEHVSSLGGAVQKVTYHMSSELRVQSPGDVRNYIDNVRLKIARALKTNMPMGKKVSLSIKARYLYAPEFPDVTLKEVYHATGFSLLLPSDSINAWISERSEFLAQLLAEYVNDGSGWVFAGIVEISVNFGSYRPHKAGKYIPLPKYVQEKKACINTQNTDDKCFAYALALGLFHKEIPNHSDCGKRPYLLNKYVDRLNLEGIEFPVNTNQIPKIEKMNDCSIHVYTLNSEREQEKKVVLNHLYSSKHHTATKVCMLKIGDKEASHYVWIKNISRLIGSSVSSHHAKHFCLNCLHGFSSVDLLEEHEPHCNRFEPTRVEMPKEDSHVEFKDYACVLKCPYIAYADIEAITYQQDVVPTIKNTFKYQHHKAASANYVIVDIDGKVVERKTFVGEDCISKMLSSVSFSCSGLAKKVREAHKPMEMSDEDIAKHEAATHCHICSKAFKKGSKRHRDHCHLTGKYRGAAHECCNINANFKNYRVPVFFHNLKGYDGHHLVKVMADLDNELTNPDKVKLDVIALNSEKYVAITWCSRTASSS